MKQYLGGEKIFPWNSCRCVCAPTLSKAGFTLKPQAPRKRIKSNMKVPAATKLKGTFHWYSSYVLVFHEFVSTDDNPSYSSFFFIYIRASCRLMIDFKKKKKAFQTDSHFYSVEHTWPAVSHNQVYLHLLLRRVTLVSSLWHKKKKKKVT